MIKEVEIKEGEWSGATFYGVECNVCGEQAEDSEGYTCWAGEDTAADAASDYNWHDNRLGGHYCPNCYTEDEETGKVKTKIYSVDKN